jgi:hypothetical protein
LFIPTNGKVAYMEKKDLIPEGDAIHSLKIAALHPRRRGEMIARALQGLLVSLPAVGTALIWPNQDRNVPWKVHYAGTSPESMQRWLAARLDYSFDVTLGALQRDLSKLSDLPFPHLICLQPAPTFPAGLWIIWPPVSPLPREALAYQEKVRQILEALIEVESLEEHYFSSISPLSDQELIKALGQGDPHASSTLLSLTRLIGNADLTFWGRAYQDVVETTDQLGAKQSGFGFAIPRGQGMGGRVAAFGIPIMIEGDYRNSPYRHPSVSAIVDREQIRSAIALPVRTHQDQDQDQERSGPVRGILYVTRRTVKPFSLAEQLLVQRMTYLLEPLPTPARPSSFLMPGLPNVPDEKAAWHKLILRANRIESLETWIGQFIQGTIIVTDSDGRPYVSARAEQLKHLRASFDRSMDDVQVISLSAPGVSLPGQVYLRSGVPLPPPEWPDFFTDLVVGCNLIIGRMEEARNHLAYQREQWLQAVLQEKPLPHIRQDGYQLGLPVGEGQIWVIAWPSQGQGQAAAPTARYGPSQGQGQAAAPTARYQGQGQVVAPTIRHAARQRALAENMVLDQLESPLLFLGDDIGVILLDSHAEVSPSRLYNALLTLFAPHPLWIVYGAHYNSLHDLKMVLTHCITLAQQARREAHSENLLDIQTLGLESLLANPRVTEDLRHFATRLLTPLLEHDKSKGTDLTTTFVLAQTLGSVQSVSDELGVHVNTVRYRLRKAEDILGIEQATPKERIAWGVASFIWTSLQQTVSSSNGIQKD